MWQTQTGSYMDCDLWSNSYGDCSSLIKCRENSDYVSSDVPAAGAHLLMQANRPEGSAPSALTNLVMYLVRLWMGVGERSKQFVRKRTAHGEKKDQLLSLVIQGSFVSLFIYFQKESIFKRVIRRCKIAVLGHLLHHCV